MVSSRSPAISSAVSRSATSAAILVQFGQEIGLSIESCLAGSGLTPTSLADPAIEILATQELAIVRNLARGLPADSVRGLEVGRRYHLTTYGIWGFALLSSRDIRSAVELGMESTDLTFGFTRAHLEVEGTEGRFRLDDEHLPLETRAFLVDRDAAALNNIQRELVSFPAPCTWITLRRSEPSDVALYEAIWGVKPTFDADANCFAFDATLLDFPLPQANEATARACEAQCRELLARRRARKGFSGEVRDRLLSGFRERSDMDAMARELAMTSRTLRRRLEDEGTSFSELVDEVRLLLAEDLLRAQNLSVAEVADKLGYSEVSNFIRAFKRLTGATPSVYRRGRQLSP